MHYTAIIFNDLITARDDFSVRCDVRAATCRGAYTLVELEASDAGDVFGQLNHGSGCELPGYGGRSMSVGDACYAGRATDLVGPCYVDICAPVGWMRDVSVVFPPVGPLRDMSDDKPCGRCGTRETQHGDDHPWRV